MAETERQLRERHQAMIRNLGAQHARIKEYGSDDAAFDEQYEQLVASAESLLEFERLMPACLAQPKRERAEQIVKWSWRGETLVAAALIATVLALGHTAWWLVLLIPHLLATLLGWSVTVTTERYRQQRAIAVGLHVLCLLVGLIAFGTISAWWIIAVLVGWVAVGVASDGTSQQGAK